MVDVRVLLVNSIQWAPHEWGLLLACGSSDESISFISTSGKLDNNFFLIHSDYITGDGSWKYSKIDKAHNVCIDYFWLVMSLFQNSLAAMQSPGLLQLILAL